MGHKGDQTLGVFPTVQCDNESKERDRKWPFGWWSRLSVCFFPCGDLLLLPTGTEKACLVLGVGDSVMGRTFHDP